jgi:hypothetical protein
MAEDDVGRAMEGREVLISLCPTTNPRRRLLGNEQFGSHTLVCTIFTDHNAILSFILVLRPKTRLNISLAVCAVAIAGIFISDRLEKAIPPPPKAAPKQS